MRRVLAAVGGVPAVVRPLGWLVLGLGSAAGLAAAYAGWRELALLAVACGVLALLAAPFLVGRTRVEVDLVLQPARVVAGSSVVVGVEVTNVSATRMLPTVLDVPVGAAVHRYGLPSLGAGARHEESFTVRTERRGVIVVGPATTRRGDPVGLFSRDTFWTRREEILVRPPLVALDALGAGLLRDLEGVATDAVSQSDLAFHALREYAPGDDLRHVHWRSSAKAMAAAGESNLLVRQYVDTRRSHATLVVDDDPAAYGGRDGRSGSLSGGAADFETAMSVAASVIVRAVLDDVEVSFVCGQQVASGLDGQLALDSVCRAGLGASGSGGLVAGARRAARTALDTSLVLLLTGAETSFEDLQRSAAAFPAEVRRIAVVVGGVETSAVTEVGGMDVLHLAAPTDVAALLQWSLR